MRLARTSVHKPKDYPTCVVGGGLRRGSSNWEDDDVVFFNDLAVVAAATSGRSTFIQARIMHISNRLDAYQGPKAIEEWPCL